MSELSEEIRDLLKRARDVIYKSTQESERLLDEATEVMSDIEDLLE